MIRLMFNPWSDLSDKITLYFHILSKIFEISSDKKKHVRQLILIAVLALYVAFIHARGIKDRGIADSENLSIDTLHENSDFHGDTMMQRSLDQYISAGWENDLYFHHDFYFTNGFQLDVFHTKLLRSPIMAVLMPTGNNNEGHTYTGLQLRQEIFTPKDLAADSISAGDHPYAATLSLTQVAVNIMPEKLMRIVTGLRLGIMGPASLGFRTQELAHRISNPSRPPQGWKYQLQNDVIVNYEVLVEKGIIKNDLFIVGGVGSGRLGTLHSDLEGGLWFMLDPGDRYFNKIGPRGGPGLQFGFHFSTTARYVLYDATLQGGIFNKTSPYALSTAELVRWIGILHMSATLELWQHQLEFYTRMATPRFQSAVPHGWIGIAYRYWF